MAQYFSGWCVVSYLWLLPHFNWIWMVLVLLSTHPSPDQFRDQLCSFFAASSSRETFYKVVFRFRQISRIQIMSSLSGNLANLYPTMTAISVGFLIMFFGTSWICRKSVIWSIVHCGTNTYPPQLRKPVRFMKSIQTAQHPNLFTDSRVMSCNLNSFAKVMEGQKAKREQKIICLYISLHLTSSSSIQPFRFFYMFKRTLMKGEWIQRQTPASEKWVHVCLGQWLNWISQE